MEYAISNTQGDHAEQHSRRAYTPLSADEFLSDRNVVIFDCEDDRTHLNEYMKPIIDEFNSSVRPYRRKDFADDYCSAVEDGRACFGRGEAKESCFHHDVIQIGNRQNLGVTDNDFNYEEWRQLRKDGKNQEASDMVKQHINNSPERQQAKEILIEIAEELKQECQEGGKYYPYIMIHGLTVHDDEPCGTCHLDWRYSVLTVNEKRGLSSRLSDVKGFKALGFETDAKSTALQKFRESVNDRIAEKMYERGLQVQATIGGEKHIKNGLYQETMRAIDAERNAFELRTFRINEAINMREENLNTLENSITERENAVLQRENEILSESMNITERETAVEQREIAVSEREKNINEIENKTIEAYRDYDKKRTQILMQLNSVNDSKTQLRSMVLNSDDILKNEFLELHKEEFDKFIDDKLSIDTSKPESIENPEYEIKRKRKHDGKHAEEPVKPLEPVTEEKPTEIPVEPVKAPEQPVKHREDDMKSILKELGLDEDYDNPQDALNAYFNR